MLLTYGTTYILFTFLNIFIYYFLSKYEVFNNNNTAILTKKYRVVNITKSFLLAIASIPGGYIIYSILYLGTIPNEVTNIVAILYCSLDLSAILYNPYNHISTNIHHIVVQFLYYYGLYYEWDDNTLCKPIVVYAIFSCFAYSVNGRLAIRRMRFNKEIYSLITKTSFVIYIICCICNWTIQAKFLLTENYGNQVYIYMFLLSIIIYDDIFLLKYLYNCVIRREQIITSASSGSLSKLDSISPSGSPSSRSASPKLVESNEPESLELLHDKSQ